MGPSQDFALAKNLITSVDAIKKWFDSSNSVLMAGEIAISLAALAIHAESARQACGHHGSGDRSE